MKRKEHDVYNLNGGKYMAFFMELVFLLVGVSEEENEWLKPVINELCYKGYSLEEVFQVTCVSLYVLKECEVITPSEIERLNHDFALLIDTPMGANLQKAFVTCIRNALQSKSGSERYAKEKQKVMDIIRKFGVE